MDWIFSYNTKYYDLHEAIHELEYIDWSTTNTVTRGKVEVGDRVYLYSVKPEMMVNYRCKVIAADKPYSTNEREVEFGGTPAGTPGPWAALQLECEFEGISYEDMRKHGLKPGVIVQRRVEGELQEYLEKMVDLSLKGSATAAKNCWLLSAGEDSYMWDVFMKDGIAAIDWHSVQTGDLGLLDEDQVDEFGLARSDTRCLWEFSHEIKPGDIIFVKKGVHQLIGIGIVRSQYYYADSDEYFKYDLNTRHSGNYRHRINVKWLKSESVVLETTFPRKTLTRINDPDKIYDYLQAFGYDHIPEDTDDGSIEVETIEKGTDDLTGEERETVVKARVNQSVFKRRLVEKYGGCCLCGINDQRLLVASHIKPWSKSDPHEKVDINNGLLLCPNHDKLFDTGLISFDDTGRLLISSQLDESNMRAVNLTDDMRIEVNDDMKVYLEYHRNNIFLV